MSTVRSTQTALTLEKREWVIKALQTKFGANSVEEAKSLNGLSVAGHGNAQDKKCDIKVTVNGRQFGLQVDTVNETFRFVGDWYECRHALEQKMIEEGMLERGNYLSDQEFIGYLNGEVNDLITEDRLQKNAKKAKKKGRIQRLTRRSKKRAKGSKKNAAGQDVQMGYTVIEYEVDQ